MRILRISQTIFSNIPNFSTYKSSLAMKLIIDTDPGTDDCAALAILLKHSHVSAVTTVHGNSSIEQTTKNACRILEFLERQNVPIYMGAHHSISSPDVAEYPSFHGSDGLGNVQHIIPNNIKKGPECGENGPNMIINLAKKHPGELTLVALGPLTNLAIAATLCPELPKLVKALYIMGGSTKEGNVTPFAEFNFYTDVTAANLVLSRFCKTGKVHLVPLETCYDSKVSKKKFESIFNDSPASSAFTLLQATSMIDSYKDGYIFFDQMIALLLTNPESVIKMEMYESAVLNDDKSSPKYGNVEYLNKIDESSENGLIVYTEFDMECMISSYRKTIEA